MSQLLKHNPDALPKPILPSWVFDRQTPDRLEGAAFSSGAALSLLHVLLSDPNSGAGTLTAGGGRAPAVFRAAIRQDA